MSKIGKGLVLKSYSTSHSVSQGLNSSGSRHRLKSFVLRTMGVTHVSQPPHKSNSGIFIHIQLGKAKTVLPQDLAPHGPLFYVGHSLATSEGEVAGMAR